ncbi:ABC transporter ATP-binding protein [Actinomyces wuliandei]|uniref:ABC transporter ATP-binding protein n=1 Tax=Actinomyces wuliandei TaxID=2057743 RepID=UPI000FDA37B9|nr:ATP-binding cassette domain-containing protein [Actinomyces wuliandei]
MIELRDVSKTFRDGQNHSHHVFESLTHVFGDDVASTAILGESGCGKSTLLSLLGLLSRPDSGCVVLSGTDVTAMPDSRRGEYRLRNIGMVFQEFNLVPELCLWENVALPSVALGGSFAARRSRALDLLARVGCDGLAERLPSQVSGGQMQRVAVARALVNRPALILADEPTGNLDPKTGSLVVEALTEAARSTRLLIVTHDAAVARRMDEVLVLSDGGLRRQD